MTLPPDEQARELAIGIGGHVLDSWQRERVIREVKLAIARVRLAEAELIRDEYLDAGGWELANKEDFDKHVAELMRQAAGETK